MTKTPHMAACELTRKISRLSFFTPCNKVMAFDRFNIFFLLCYGGIQMQERRGTWSEENHLINKKAPLQMGRKVQKTQ